MAYLQYLATPRILATLIVGARWSKELIWQDSFMQHFAPAMFTDEGKRLWLKLRRDNSLTTFPCTRKPSLLSFYTAYSASIRWLWSFFIVFSLTDHISVLARFILWFGHCFWRWFHQTNQTRQGYRSWAPLEWIDAVRAVRLCSRLFYCQRQRWGPISEFYGTLQFSRFYRFFALLIPLQAWAWANGYFKARAREIRLTLPHLSHVPDVNEMTHLNQRNH